SRVFVSRNVCLGSLLMGQGYLSGSLRWLQLTCDLLASRNRQFTVSLRALELKDGLLLRLRRRHGHGPRDLLLAGDLDRACAREFGGVRSVRREVAQDGARRFESFSRFRS